jgi:hypothetical protein
VLGVVVTAAVGVAAGTSGVDCELGNAAPGVGENALAGPFGVGAVGDDGTDGVSAIDRVRSTVASPAPVVVGDGVEGMPVVAGDRGVRTDRGGTMVAGPYPGPASFGAAMTNGARATTTIKPMTIPTPV